MLPFALDFIKIMESNQQVKIREITETDIPGYKPLLMLGQGSYGSVHLCEDRENRTWAVKVLPISDEEDSILKKLKRAPKEILRPHHASYPIGRDRYYLFYPLMITDLRQYYNTTIFTRVERKILIIQMLRALEYLHGVLIAHRDIKSDNILIKQFLPPTFVLSDFSIAKFYTTQTQLEGTNEFVKDILQLAAMVWSLSFGQRWKYPIHTMKVQDWAQDEEIQKTFNQTTCPYTNAFFQATLGAKKMSQVKKPYHLLLLFPSNVQSQMDEQKYLQPVKLRSLRSQKLEFRPIPIEEQPEAQNQPQSAQPQPQDHVSVEIEEESHNGIVKETYHDVLKKKYDKIQFSDVRSKLKQDLDKISKKRRIMQKARNSRRLTLKKTASKSKCAFCFKQLSLSNWARHRKTCLEKMRKQRVAMREKELKEWGVK